MHFLFLSIENALENVLKKCVRKCFPELDMQRRMQLAIVAHAVILFVRPFADIIAAQCFSDWLN
jgi:hypothetical protein